MKKIAFIGVTGWHKNIVENAYRGFKQEIEKKSIETPWDLEIDFFGVPGALEIPLIAKKCIETKKYDSIACAGFIVDSGIYQHKFVAQTVLDSMMQISLDSGVPVLSAVLTPKTFQENEAQIEFFEKHFVKKGEELATACIETLKNIDQF